MNGNQYQRRSSSNPPDEVILKLIRPPDKSGIMVFREIDDDLWEIVQKYSPNKARISADPDVTPAGCSTVSCMSDQPDVPGSIVPTKYGTKSTVHRYHLELCEKGVYQRDLPRPAPIRV